AVIGNLFRSYALSVLAYRHGIDILDKWHDTAGWSILAFTSVGVMALAWVLSRMEGIRNDQPTSDSTHASA
ncbi:MAG: hypothetical protein RLZ45_1946, partial [Verrucomicrobiota bacterium]